MDNGSARPDRSPRGRAPCQGVARAPLRRSTRAPAALCGEARSRQRAEDERPRGDFEWASVLARRSRDTGSRHCSYTSTSWSPRERASGRASRSARSSRPHQPGWRGPRSVALHRSKKILLVRLQTEKAGLGVCWSASLLRPRPRLQTRGSMPAAGSSGRRSCGLSGGLSTVSLRVPQWSVAAALCVAFHRHRGQSRSS